VCSEARASVLFRPCGHMVACAQCASIMKKCVECRAPIEEMVSLAVCQGAKVANVEKGEGKQKQKKVTSNNASVMAAKSNAVASNRQNSSAASNSQPSAANLLMNNGNRDTSNTDVQKLQEQLNDIKEQVRNALPLQRLRPFFPSRRCAPCAWTG